MGEIQELKMILREETSPFFTDEEIAYYLEKNKNSINDAAYECLLLKDTTENIMGIEVSCKLLGGTLTKTQTLDYAKIDVEQALSAYSEAGGIYPEYKYLQDMDGIEKNMKAAGYTCNRIK